MVHQVLGAYQGQGTDIQMHAQETLRISDILSKVLSHHTGQPLDKIKQDTDRDYFMGPEDAKEYGLIDQILESRHAKA